MRKSIYNQRQEYWEILQQLTTEKHSKMDALDESMSDEEWNSKMNELSADYDNKIFQAAHRWFWLQYKSSRNKWFMDFVGSFGLCENRRISKKQAEVFVRYSEENHSHERGRGTSYFVRVNNLCVQTTWFSEHEPAYVTIGEF